ncbi:hypothetical protein [Kitasatospora purpeofusca]|uniref:Uncharacterized protein n=1 Tax=Kitasatospora purpeofusca TaxID=67352 RepID=A0ABZ1UB44_9ACTN|nr:hypothetical protein [Kitasatospora purpeofusca]
MAPVPNGVYAIAKQYEQLITLLEPKDLAVLLPPTGQPGDQEWQIEGRDDGNVTIRNLRHQTFLTYDNDPNLNEMIMGSTEPRPWALYQAAQPFTFHVVVPGGPIEGVELALDLSLLRIFPPRLALRPLDVNDQRQAWKFEFHE